MFCIPAGESAFVEVGCSVWERREETNWMRSLIVCSSEVWIGGSGFGSVNGHIGGTWWVRLYVGLR